MFSGRGFVSDFDGFQTAIHPRLDLAFPPAALRARIQEPVGLVNFPALADTTGLRLLDEDVDRSALVFFRQDFEVKTEGVGGDAGKSTVVECEAFDASALGGTERRLGDVGGHRKLMHDERPLKPD